jgi:hypothetical protein
MEGGYLENRSVDEKRIFKEYGGRRGVASFASKQGPVAVLLKKVKTLFAYVPSPVDWLDSSCTNNQQRALQRS